MIINVSAKTKEYGTFNLHASILPNYRGAAPINWAIINKEAETGVTTFLIDEKGFLIHEWRKVKVKTHIEDVLNTLKELD